MSGIRINGKLLSDFSPAVQAAAEKFVELAREDVAARAADTLRAGLAEALKDQVRQETVGEAPRCAVGKETSGAAADAAAADPGYRDFCWVDDAEDVVVPAQPSIAVYENPNGQVVIRSSPLPGCDQDEIVILSPDYAIDLAESIISVARNAIEDRAG